jgi:hypothetical protein
MYKVIKMFTDLQDNSFRYNAGDIFPRKGLKVSDKRLEELSTTKNRRHIPLIKKIEEEKPEPKLIESKISEVTEPEEKPRKRGRKKDKDAGANS